MKITIKGFIFWQKYDWQDAPSFVHREFDASNDKDMIKVCPHDIEVEIPNDFDPVPGQVEKMRAEKQRILAEAHVKAQNIEQQIQELLCIEYKPQS